MKYSRRNFLKTAATGVGAVLVGGCFTESGSHDPYDLVEIGKTGIKTTRLAMGTGIRGGNRQSNLTRLGHEQAVQLVRQIYEHGVRMFDMADSYGTHACVSEALKIYPRNEYVLFTKLVPRRRPTAEGELPGAETEAEVQRFLEEMQTDYIDGLQLHGYNFSGNWNTEYSAYMTAFDKLKERGIIRAHGLSSHSLDAIQTAVNEPWVDAMHVRFNAYGTSMDDSTEKVEPVVRQLHQAGKGVIAMKVYGEGAFSNSDELRDGSLRFVLQSGIVDVLTIGMDKIGDMEDTEIRIRNIVK
jgi:aryl-alcohol dehydrogenase-like predicted oxidoreductase